MQVIVSARGLSISKTYKDALTRKLAKLEPLVPEILETKVVLSKEKHRRTASLTLAAKRRTFRSVETAEDLAAAVDRAVDALVRQVREAKDRAKSRKERRTRRAVVAPVLARPAMPDLHVRRVPLKPMSVEEATAELGLGSDAFVVFTNAATDAINVLYRRADGALGLVEPVA